MLIFGREINKRTLFVLVVIAYIVGAVFLYLTSQRPNPNRKPISGVGKSGSSEPINTFVTIPNVQTLQPDTSPAYVEGQLVVKFKTHISPVKNKHNVLVDEALNSNHKKFFEVLNQFKISKIYQLIEDEIDDSESVSRYYIIEFSNLKDTETLLETCKAFPDEIERCDRNAALKKSITFNDPGLDTYQYWAEETNGANLRKAWDITTGSGVVLSIADQCYYNAHEDLAPNIIFANPNAIRAADGSGCHGTGTAGMMAAKGNNGKGIVGTCPDCKIRGYDFGASMAVLANSLRKANRDGVKVMNFSFGGPPDFGAAFEIARDAATGGVIFVVSAGNCRDVNDQSIENCNSVGSPQDWPFVILAPASNSGGTRASFSSNYAAVAQRGVMAPGQGVITPWENLYQQVDGTSFSAPLVSGVIGLMLSIKNNLTPTQVKTALYRTARDKGSPGPDNNTGYGLVDACAAVMCVKDLKDSKPSCFDNPPTIHCDTTSGGNPSPTPTGNPSGGATPTPQPTTTPTGGPGGGDPGGGPGGGDPGGGPGGGDPGGNPGDGVPLPTGIVQPSATPYPTITNPKPLPKPEACVCGWNVWCYLGCNNK